MYPEETKYLLALSYVKGLGIKSIKELLQQVNSAQEIWESSTKQKNALTGINSSLADQIGSAKILELAEKEIQFCVKHQIAPINKFQSEYPKLLKECVDAPLVIFCRGNLNWENQRFVSVVGTRKMTSRGKEVIAEIIQGFAQQPITIVSGLALGVDAEAHKAALGNDLQTIGVLAHGVNQIFPKTNEKIAHKMMLNGGLLSEFSTFHAPEPENFLRRNRIIAGLCEATIVVESGISGGAMSTAAHANNYNRDVFAVPGRVKDIQSEGCHALIKNHQAFLLTEANDVLKYLNITPKRKKKSSQIPMLLELTSEEQKLYDLLQKQGKSHLDNIAMHMGLQPFRLLPLLLDMELKNIIEPMAGKYYDLV